MALFSLGKDAKLYWGATDAVIGAMTELTSVKDVTLNLDAADVDVTTRANSGWRASAAGLKECTVDFDLQQIPLNADTAFVALRTAFLAGTTVELAILDGAKGTSNVQGPKGNFSITSFSRKEGLEDSIIISVTAKMSLFSEWLVVA